MLAKDVEIIDIDPVQHERFFAMLPRGSSKRDGLILFYSDNRLFHAVHTRTGPVNREVNFRGPAHLRELAEEHDADFVVCLEKNALRRFAADAQSAVLYDDPLSAQGLAVYGALKRELGAGIHLYPDPLSNMPRIPPAAARLGRKIFLGNSLIIAAVLDDEAGVWTSAVVEFRRGEISLITTTDFLDGADVSGLPSDEAARALIRRLAEKRGRPSLGLFCDRQAFAHIASHPRPLSAILFLARRGWIRLKPFPSRLRLLARAAAMLGL